MTTQRKVKIEFRKINIQSQIHRKPLFDVYYAVKNGRCKVADNYNSLDKKTKGLIKRLIINMATIKDYKSERIKYTLNQYNYGELRPIPHRFFFFRKCGNNYVFFEYELKKANQLKDSLYKEIERKKETYEREFKKYKEKKQSG